MASFENIFELIDWNTVKYATTGALPAYNSTAIALTGSSNGVFPSIDGTPVAVGEEILIKDQNDEDDIDNGHYFMVQTGSAGDPWIVKRIANPVTVGIFDGGQGKAVKWFVSEGSLNAHTQWTADPPSTPGDSIIITRLPAGILGPTSSLVNQIPVFGDTGGETLLTSSLTLSTSSSFTELATVLESSQPGGLILKHSGSDGGGDLLLTSSFGGLITVLTSSNVGLSLGAGGADGLSLQPTLVGLGGSSVAGAVVEAANGQLNFSSLGPATLTATSDLRLNGGTGGTIRFYNAAQLPPLPGADVMFFVSGSPGTKDGSARRIALFGGDVHVSGNLTVDGAGSSGASPFIITTSASLSGLLADVLETSKPGGLVLKRSGSDHVSVLALTSSGAGIFTETILTSSKTLRIRGGNEASIRLDSNSVQVSSRDVDVFANGATGFVPGMFLDAGLHRTTLRGETIIVNPLTGGVVLFDNTSQPTSAPGEDIWFFVSGAEGSKDGFMPRVAAFGGDVHISGGITATSDNVKVDLVREGYVASDFSIVKIPVSRTVTVPSGSQMLYEGVLEVDGILNVEGETVANDDEHDKMQVPSVQVSGSPLFTPAFGDFVRYNPAVAAFSMGLPSPGAGAGRSIEFKNIGASLNAVTIIPDTGTIDGESTLILSESLQPTVIRTDGVNWWKI